MAKLQIQTEQGSYPIMIQPGAIRSLQDYLPDGNDWIVITDKNVAKEYGGCWEAPHQYVLEPGEGSKSMDTVGKALEYMLAHGLSRRTVVVAIGGGVVGDTAGFIASIFLRGVPFIQVPTTLLAQVDSSVGGKTGVNTRFGKNTVGSFYQPQKVIIDPETLQTLPHREIINGLGEVIKYGIIYDHGLLQDISEQWERILTLEPAVLGKIIHRCCAIKAEVVNADFTEQGLRRILNHGHTIGHALEAITEYQHYTHGEAVAIGMLYEAKFARALGMLERDHYRAIKELLLRLELDFAVDEYSTDGLIGHMQHDKKNHSGRISFLLPTGPGKVEEVLLRVDEVRQLWKELVH